MRSYRRFICTSISDHPSFTLLVSVTKRLYAATAHTIKAATTATMMYVIFICTIIAPAIFHATYRGDYFFGGVAVTITRLLASKFTLPAPSPERHCCNSNGRKAYWGPCCLEC